MLLVSVKRLYIAVLPGRKKNISSQQMLAVKLMGIIKILVFRPFQFQVKEKTNGDNRHIL